MKPTPDALTDAAAELAARRRRIVVPLAAFSALWVGGFLLASGFARPLLTTQVAGPVTVGWLYAVSLVPVVLLVTLVHSRQSRRLDPLRDTALAAARGEDGRGGSEVPGGH